MYPSFDVTKYWNCSSFFLHLCTKYLNWFILLLKYISALIKSTWKGECFFLVHIFKSFCLWRDLFWILTLSYFGPCISDGDGCNFQPNGSIKLKFFVNSIEFCACCPSGTLMIAKSEYFYFALCCTVLSRHSVSISKKICISFIHFIGNLTY